MAIDRLTPLSCREKARECRALGRETDELAACVLLEKIAVTWERLAGTLAANR
jgi:hypothetical protein